MRYYFIPLVLTLSASCFQIGSAFSPSSRQHVAPTRRAILARSTITRDQRQTRHSRTLLSETKDGDETISVASTSQEEPNLLSKLLSNFRTASSDGFGTRARNVGSTMEVGDIVVPLSSNLDKRQSLAQIGLYAGVEYIICDMEEGSGEEGERSIDERIATIKPAYPLRPHLERSDWPITLPVSDVPLWISKNTYEAGTALGTLMLAGSYLAIASILATIVRIVVVPSESMEPALMPGDVVLVTRSILTKPKANDVAFFNPPKELDYAIANSSIGRAAAAAAAASAAGTDSPSESPVQIVSTKGKQFLKRVVGVPGDVVGVSNSNPYTLQCNEANTDCTYQVDRTGDYSRPDVFPDESWNRVTPTINFGNNGAEDDVSTASTRLAKGQYFVAGDNGYRSVDSRVWGPLKEKYLFGTAHWVIFPAKHFGPIQPGPFVVEKDLIGETSSRGDL